MGQTAKARTVAGLAVISGVMLIGTSGLTFAFGWALWAAGLGVLLLAIDDNQRSDGGGRRAAALRSSAPSGPARW